MGDSAIANSESSLVTCFKQEEKSTAGWEVETWSWWLARRSSLAIREAGAEAVESVMVALFCAQHSRSIIGKSQAGLRVSRVTARLIG